MSQNDMVIANADGATVRADINSALQALASTSKGTSRPSTAYAGQPWLDDDTPSSTVWTKNIFDGTDDIPIGYLDTTNNLWLNPIGGGTATLSSGSTVDLGSVPQNLITISGTTGPITSFGSSMQPGRVKIVTFDDSPTITYDGTSMILQGGADITPNAGDMAIVYCLSAGNYQVAFFSFGAVTTSVSPMITGYIPTSISGTSTTGAVTISSGVTSDSTNARLLSGGSFSWAVSNGNAANGYQGGTTLPNSSTIHFYVIAKSDGSSIASFASTSLTPTLPSGYSGGYYRRIFSLKTNSSGTLYAGNATEVEGGAMVFYPSSFPATDVAVSNLSTTRTLYNLTVPTGIKVHPFCRMDGNASRAASWGFAVMSPDEADVSVSAGYWSSANGADFGSDSSGNAYTGACDMSKLITNTSGQIAARGSTGSSMTFNLNTLGWKDFRR